MFPDMDQGNSLLTRIICRLTHRYCLVVGDNRSPPPGLYGLLVAAFKLGATQQAAHTPKKQQLSARGTGTHKIDAHPRLSSCSFFFSLSE